MCRLRLKVEGLEGLEEMKRLEYEWRKLRLGVDAKD
jgi:hypothetical protein